MLECINKECTLNNSRVCTNPMFAKDKCEKRINPDHTPNYAEEQLEYAKENKTNLMEQVKKCVNYEEGYFELLKENEELKATNKGLVEEIKDKNINYQVNIEELHKEIDQVLEEKEKLKESNLINHNEYKEHLKKKDEHIMDLNQLIEKKDIKIEKLENQLENELGRNRILKDKLDKPTITNNYEAEINSLRCQYEEAKCHIERLEKQAEENKSKLENYKSLKRMAKVLIEGL